VAKKFAVKKKWASTCENTGAPRNALAALKLETGLLKE
jgi:hypothetical protein